MSSEVHFGVNAKALSFDCFGALAIGESAPLASSSRFLLLEVSLVLF